MPPSPRPTRSPSAAPRRLRRRRPRTFHRVVLQRRRLDRRRRRLHSPALERHAHDHRQGHGFRRRIADGERHHHGRERSPGRVDRGPRQRGPFSVERRHPLQGIGERLRRRQPHHPDDLDVDIDGPIGTGGEFTRRLSPGSHTITARATDSDGGSRTATVTIAVANTPPTIAIRTPAANDSFTSGDDVVFLGKANDADDGDLSSSILWTSDRDGVLGTGSTIRRSCRRARTSSRRA